MEQSEIISRQRTAMIEVVSFILLLIAGWENILGIAMYLFALSFFLKPTIDRDCL